MPQSCLSRPTELIYSILPCTGIRSCRTNFSSSHLHDNTAHTPNVHGFVKLLIQNCLGGQESCKEHSATLSTSLDGLEKQLTDAANSFLCHSFVEVPSELHNHSEVSNFNGTIGREKDIATCIPMLCIWCAGM